MQHKVTAQIGSTQISIETGKIAKLADGSVIVSCGDTIVLVSAVSATTIKEGQDWFPLTVDYREKAAAVGKFPGGYFKREGRPSEKETLTSRMTDRPLRPLFPAGYLYDTQIISHSAQRGWRERSRYSRDQRRFRCALRFRHSVRRPDRRGARRPRQRPVHRQPDPRPSASESDLDLVYVGTENDVIMIEGAANEIAGRGIRQGARVRARTRAAK